MALEIVNTIIGFIMEKFLLNPIEFNICVTNIWCKRYTPNVVSLNLISINERFLLLDQFILFAIRNTSATIIIVIGES